MMDTVDLIPVLDLPTDQPIWNGGVMRRFTCLAAVVWTLLLASCAPQTVDMAVLRKAIDERNTAAAASMLAGRVTDAVLAYHAENAVEMPPGEPTVRGKDAIRQRMSKLTESGLKVKSMRFTSTDVQAANQPDVDYTGKYVMLWRKQTDGSWRVAADIWNPDAPMPALPTGGSIGR
jgi:ketosteroid isomerase-like protein